MNKNSLHNTKIQVKLKYDPQDGTCQMEINFFQGPNKTYYLDGK